MFSVHFFLKAANNVIFIITIFCKPNHILKERKKCFKSARNCFNMKKKIITQNNEKY